jgi:hypothetical protein
VIRSCSRFSSRTPLSSFFLRRRGQSHRTCGAANTRVHLKDARRGVVDGGGRGGQILLPWGRRLRPDPPRVRWTPSGLARWPPSPGRGGGGRSPRRGASSAATGRAASCFFLGVPPAASDSATPPSNLTPRAGFRRAGTGSNLFETLGPLRALLPCFFSADVALANAPAAPSSSPFVRRDGLMRGGAVGAMMLFYLIWLVHGGFWVKK